MTKLETAEELAEVEDDVAHILRFYFIVSLTMK